MKDQEDKFVSADLYLCSYLKAQGHKFEDIRTGRQIKFVFLNSEKLQKHVKGFYNGEDLIGANEFCHCLKDLKAIIFNLPR